MYSFGVLERFTEAILSSSDLEYMNIDCDEINYKLYNYHKYMCVSSCITSRFGDIVSKKKASAYL